MIQTISKKRRILAVSQSKTESKGLSLDVLLLLLLAPAHIVGRDAYIVVLALLVYLLLSFWHPLPSTKAEVESTKRNRLAYLSRYTLLLIVAAAAVIVPTVTNIIERASTPVEADGFSPVNITLSDSAMQTELAVSFLAEGSNPYEEQYDDTPLRFYQWLDANEPGWKDPIFEYFVYLPGNLLISLPIYLVSERFDLLYDQRVVFLIFYIILLMVLPHLVNVPAIALALVAAVGLNPLFTKSVILGMNDSAVFLFLVLTIFGLTRRRFLWSAAFLGIACGLKQYAWFVIPFFLLYIWQQTPIDRRRRQIALSIGLISGITLLVILPFFLWNPGAFYTDTVAFPASRAEFLYPIRGFTIGRLLMGSGIIPSFFAPFPFQLLQLLVGVPLLILLLRYQIKRGLSALPVAAAVFIFVTGYFSRFFHENYVGVLIALISIGILLDLSQEKEHNLNNF